MFLRSHRNGPIGRDFVRLLVVTLILASSQRSLHPLNLSVSVGPKPSGHSTVGNTPPSISIRRDSSTLLRMRAVQFFLLSFGTGNSPISSRRRPMGISAVSFG